MKTVLILVFIAALSFLTCNNIDEKKISNVLDEREKAFETQDELLYSKIISDNYKIEDKGEIKTKETVIKEFKINISPFDKIDFTHKDRTVYQSENTAKVVQKTKAILKIDQKKTNYELTEILKLVKENQNWKISKESNIDLFRGFVFGKN